MNPFQKKRKKSKKSKKQDSINEQKSEKGSVSQEKNVSQILQDVLRKSFIQSQSQEEVDPETRRNRNNILLVIMLLCAYAVYRLIGNFLDVILLAYVAGIAYLETSKRFVIFVKDHKTYLTQPEPWKKRALKIIGWILFAGILPRLKYMLENPNKSRFFPSLGDFISSILKTDSFVVLVCEIFIFLNIVYLLIGSSFGKIAIKLRGMQSKNIRSVFLIFIILAMVVGAVSIPATLYKQIGKLGAQIESKIQQRFECQLISFKNNKLPLCIEKIQTTDNLIKQMIQDFRQQNQTLEKCKIFLDKQIEHLKSYIQKFNFIDLSYYQQVTCTWYSFFYKAISYSGYQLEEPNAQHLKKVFTTGTSLFTLFFGQFAGFISFLSNTFFKFTIFLTILYLTIRYDTSSDTLKRIFSQNKNQLVTSITNLVHATLLIAVEHFFMSYIVLSIFGIIQTNLVMSMILSSMAMIPFFRPWFGIALLTIFKIIFNTYQQIYDYYISIGIKIVFLIVYYVMSQRIYSRHYRQMELHEIITNLSVLFGIYCFGVIGVLYGPLIIIISQTVQRELFRRYYHKVLQKEKN